MTDWPSCWCGNSPLVPFSSGYGRCARCETLVSLQMPATRISRVVDDGTDFYGRNYWFLHQERDLGCPTIGTRVRTDLPERCLHWLRTLLKYKLPAGTVLEIGSGPGGFVVMLQWAGFAATGLELSPWVADFIRDTFQVPVLCGPVEDQEIEPASLDVIAMMDVLEHLPDPVNTLRHCLTLLRPDGILLIQTPCYVEGRAYEDMVAEGDRFLEMLKPPDHLYVFSRRSVRDLFRRLGAEHVTFEPALFAEYDMCAVVSRMRPATHGSAAVEAVLSARPAGRMVQALLDLDAERSNLRERYAEAEADRRRRLAALEAQGRQLGEVEGERNALRAEVGRLREERERVEADRAARAEVIEAQGRQLGEVEGERNALRAEVGRLREERERLEADRAARAGVIEAQGRQLGEVEGGRNALRAEVGRLREERERLEADREAEVTAERQCAQAALGRLHDLEDRVRLAKNTRGYKLLRWLRRRTWLDKVIFSARADAPSAQPGAAPEEARFDAAYARIREPKTKGGIDYGPGAEDRIVGQLRAEGFDVRSYAVDATDYRRYVVSARYLEDFPDYYPSQRAEKSLEHYIAGKLLELSDNDTYIDIASEHSPAPDIYRRLFGTVTYRQDLAYPPGVDGDRIGGDAAHLPLPDGFATKLALHCSFEHLEGESDIGFVREVPRILRSGGSACIVPLYLCEEYAIQTDPEVAVPGRVVFEEDATVYCARGWGNRFGRFYDPAHLASRLRPSAHGLTIEVYRIINAAQVDASCYVRFAMVLRKP